MEGTQIGLRSAQRLIELMDGEMRTHTEGSTFSVVIRLPRLAQPA